MKQKLRKTHSEFVKEMQLINNDIKIIDKYKNNYTKIHVKCKICDFEWSTFPTGLLNEHSCPECWKSRARLSEDIFLEKIKFTSNDSVEVLDDYVGLLYTYRCRCKKCSYEWSTTGSILIKGHACPKCCVSQGERIIASVLDNFGISYNVHKTYPQLKGIGKRCLSYDFYLPNYNLLVEFQGEQHEHPVDYFGGKQQFEIQKEHDKRKRDYAEQNKISLLEIWYYDIDNIEPILLQKIKEINENNLKLESVETVTVA